jgi:RNA polymerase primary sigma factor
LLSDTVREVLEKLDKREGYIIQERFGLNGRTPKTLEEIGYDLGLTRERVRQIESVAMKKLRTSAKASSIRAFA